MSDSNGKRALRELSVAERILLVQDLWDSIASDQGAMSMSEEQRAELNRRLDRYEADPSEFITWQDIQASLREATG